MKKLLLFAATAGFLFSACQKEDTGNPMNESSTISGKTYTPPATGSISPVPTSFLKKVMVEEFVGAQIGTTPEANYDLYKIVLGNYDRVYSASLHVSDDMTTFQSKFVMNTMGSISPPLPCGLINRYKNNGQPFLDSKQFNGTINMILNKPVDCGVAINSIISGGRINASIHVGFTATMPGAYKVTVYLIEDLVSNQNIIFDQANAYNNIPTSHFYHKGNPIKSYQHRSIVRNTLTAPNGNSINQAANIPGGSDVINLQFDMPAKYSPTSSYKLMAFITEVATNEIVNVQQADLGATKDWN